ncbi:chorismate mutase OS=Tsukamurella paurometabola (strain ATCC 8368 / DSM / CCUG 35730 / CIP 100753/ JCM 10117 / KCTC 9821 / NBRC 16120 / NCIMB 702349 /NCTC 13040) OX=521096 GN=Tpau_3314 PE=4 SV=1 [Tsukamurella paurometabola]|uniref:chorismate mutase n=1 Tax=Tsukamurella paurometabola (strain ATCC 8368 / DSM 20162 / CCUG 35730 / CIP 100753 / JCM 10117 / KCTC 9821 / NBRC 16120 / NCIMB 702349 / NCTC 13040) TaxID=521096 RepID=D5UWA0_TSUPD|nr:gamma subclass chorismate mutase AroQ [Tsukamurella paurometabola]ADG79899.1 chorismate mutase [Tsukamurella paurometabola DSM 20162]SUP37580.1 Secreted chorismate mutase precursor [Tsukamurella paurometabola]
MRSPGKRWFTAVAALLVVVAGSQVGGGAATAAPALPQTAPVAVVDLLGQRLALAEEVAATKWRERRPVRDAAQADAVVRSAVAQGRQRDLDEQYVTAVFSDQIAASESVQFALHGRWSIDRTADPKPGDLVTVRSTLAALTPRILDSLRALETDARGVGACEADVRSATQQQIDARRWSDERGAALRFAVSRLCPSRTA